MPIANENRLSHLTDLAQAIAARRGCGTITHRVPAGYSHEAVVGQLRVDLELAKGETDLSLGTIPPLEDAVPG